MKHIGEQRRRDDSTSARLKQVSAMTPIFLPTRRSEAGWLASKHTVHLSSFFFFFVDDLTFSGLSCDSIPPFKKPFGIQIEEKKGEGAGLVIGLGVDSARMLGGFLQR